MIKGMQAAAQANPVMDGVDLFLFERAFDGRLAVATDVQMTTVQEGQVIPQQTITIHREAATLLMNDLWNAGIRPTIAKAADETLGAQRRHIEDLEKITFQLLDTVTKHESS